MRASRIAGTGRYLPVRVLTNDELAQRVATSDEWIRTRTGIRQRHIAAPEEQTSDLALRASRAAIAAAGMTPADIDLIIVATATPDMIFPSTACILQDKLGVSGGAALDVGAVCSGFVYGLALADKMVSTRRRAQRAGRGRGNLLAHPRLDRPRHLRAVRRRRGRRRRRAVRTNPESSRRTCTRTAAIAASSACRARCRTAASRARRSCTWTAAPCSSSRSRCWPTSRTRRSTPPA